MNNIQRIEQLLDRYIEINKKKKVEYENNKTKIDLYKQLFIYLDNGHDSIKENTLIISILFNTIYNNNIYFDEFNSLLIKMDIDRRYEGEFNKFVKKIKEEYSQLTYDNNSLLEQIRRNRDTVSSAYRTKISFKNKRPINDGFNDIVHIKRIFSYFEIEGVIDNKEELMLINEIELYNRSISTNKDNVREQQYYTSLYEKIPNILDSGFQEHDKIQVSQDRRSMLDKFANEIYNYSNDYSIDETISCIESYRKYNLSDDEYNYIIVKVLDKYLDDLMFYYQCLLEKEVYSHIKDRKETINSYYILLDRYLYLREYYEKINEVYVDENSEVDNKELLDKSIDKRLIFTHSNSDIAKAKIITDMDDIPYEYYDKVIDLLNGFRYGELTRNEIKPFRTTHKKMTNYFELRDDQVRIVMKHISNNIYCVMGVFTKKSDNLRKEYCNMTSRSVPNVDSEDRLNLYLQLSEKVLEELESKVNEYSRKGTR